MRVSILMLFLSGCFLFEPTETGSSAMVGRVLSPRGVAMGGVEVQTLEARSKTDAGGAFSVAWKAPGQHVSFDWEGAHYLRRYLPDDEGERVDIRLPEVRNAALECRLNAPCPVRLTWDLGNGLTATADAACATTPPPLLGIPKGLPAAQCKGAGSGDTPLSVTDAGESLRISDPPREVHVVVKGSGCRVALRGGDWRAGESIRAMLAGEATASAVCDEGVAVPARLGPADTEVALEVFGGAAWSVVGASREGADVRLIGETGPLKGVAGLLVAQDGRVALPVGLPEGSYRLVAGDAGLLMTPPESGPNGLVWRRSRDGWLGRITLSKPLSPGELPAVELTAP